MIGRLRTYISERVSNFILIYYACLISGIVIVVFDLLKKTVFLGAPWNYDYPVRTLAYSMPAMVLLVALTIILVILFPKIDSLSSVQFLVTIAVAGGVLYATSFFILPKQSAYHALTPGKGMYCASLSLTENGLLHYFSHFHEIGRCGGQFGSVNETESREYFRGGARYLQTRLTNAEWFPLHEDWAGYASEISTQKHGPIPPMIAGFFMIVFGDAIGNAVVGNYVAAASLPVIGYGLFRTQFSEELSRFGAVLLLLSPAIFFYARNHTVAYDLYASAFSTLAMFFFMSSLNTKRTVYAVGTGIAFSLAVLSKVTVVLLVVPFLIIAFVRGESTHDTIKKLIVFLLASITIPLGLLVAGYNLAIQALYQFALLRTGEGNNATGFFLLNQNPNPDLGNPLLNFLARTYHFRMIGYAILIFVAIAVCLLVVRRSNLTERLKFGIALASPVVVFVTYQYGLNLARQLLPYYGGIWFLGLAGVSWTVRDVPKKKRLLLYITALALTAASTLINL